MSSTSIWVSKNFDSIFFLMLSWRVYKFMLPIIYIYIMRQNPNLFALYHVFHLFCKHGICPIQKYSRLPSDLIFDFQIVYHPLPHWRCPQESIRHLYPKCLCFSLFNIFNNQYIKMTFAPFIFLNLCPTYCSCLLGI